MERPEQTDTIECNVCKTICRADPRDGRACRYCYTQHLEFMKPELTKWMIGLTPFEKSKLLKEVMMDFKERNHLERLPAP